MLILPIKKQWFDLIIQGIKKEEYREIKPYYITRLKNEISVYNSFGQLIKAGHLCDDNNLVDFMNNQSWEFYVEVLFRNGYSNDSPSFKTMCKATIGEGNPDWGAIPGEKYFILTPENIES